MFVGNSITVLFQKPFRFVSDVQRVVGNRERGVSKAGLLENGLVLGLCELRVKFRQERGIGSSWKSRLLVEESQDTEPSLDNVDTRLIIGKFDESPVDLFTNIFLLLEFEYVGVELFSRKTCWSKQCIGETNKMSKPLAAAFHWHN